MPLMTQQMRTPFESYTLNVGYAALHFAGFMCPTVQQNQGLYTTNAVLCGIMLTSLIIHHMADPLYPDVDLALTLLTGMYSIFAIMEIAYQYYF